MKIEEYRGTKDWPYHISAGGVVFRRNENSDIEVLILYRNISGNRHYHLSKGTLHFDESLEDCARREVEEESGAKVEIVGYLGAMTDEYVSPRWKFLFNKTTHYFAMEFKELTRKHDFEHDGVEWLLIDEARSRLTETEPLKEEFIIIDRLKDFLGKFKI